MSGLCRWCGNEIKRQRLVFCSKQCLVAHDRAERKSLREEIRYKEKPPRFERRTFITDAEQRKINLEVDERYHVKLESKRYKPGDPEFDAVAAQCTHPTRIKSDSVIDGLERCMRAAPKMSGRLRIS